MSRLKLAYGRRCPGGGGGGLQRRPGIQGEHDAAGAEDLAPLKQLLGVLLVVPQAGNSLRLPHSFGGDGVLRQRERVYVSVSMCVYVLRVCVCLYVFAHIVFCYTNKTRTHIRVMGG